MISVHNLKKSFGNVQVLKGINIEIRKGECVCIIGPSGSGKSTFLRCLNLLEVPDEGEIIIEGESILEKRKDIDKYRENVGMVFQHFNLFPNMTVLKNITLAPVRLGKWKKEEADEKAIGLLKRIGLEKKALSYPSKLSGGQKQRVACARAIITQPSLILADEPTGALDSKSARMLLESFETLNHDLSATILMVTHDAFTASYCHRILFIKDGKIFNELIRGNSTRKEFFDKIISVVTLLGGDNSNVF